MSENWLALVLWSCTNECVKAFILDYSVYKDLRLTILRPELSNTINPNVIDYDGSLIE